MKEIERAARRVGERPWKDHPLGIHFGLYRAGELSSRVKKEMEEHLGSCRACALAWKALNFPVEPSH